MFKNLNYGFWFLGVLPLAIFCGQNQGGEQVQKNNSELSVTTGQDLESRVKSLEKQVKGLLSREKTAKVRKLKPRRFNGHP